MKNTRKQTKNQNIPVKLTPLQQQQIKELESSFSKAAEVCQEMMNRHKAGLDALSTIKSTFEALALAFSTGDAKKLQEITIKQAPELSTNMAAVAEAFASEGRLFEELSKTLGAITGKGANQYSPENKPNEDLRGYV